MKNRGVPTVLAAFLLAAATLPAAARADEPVLAFTPAPVEFAKTTAGAESPTQAVDVHNVSGAGIAVDQVVAEGANGSDFKLSGGNCGWLDPDQHCSVWVSFAPGSAGAKTASLVVKVKEGPAESVALQGEAVPVKLAFEPDGYDFGIQRVNRGEGSATLQVRNAGEAAAQIGSVGIGGAGHDNFWTSGGDCWNGRLLQPGESCSVQVGFNPWDTVAYEAELQVSAHGTTFGAPLSGFGGRAMVEPASNPFDLGSAPVGSAGPVETIVLTNHGNLPGSFFIAVIAGGSVASFQLIDEDCTAAPVEPGATCTVQVRFVPQVEGTKTARLALFGDEDGGTMVMLSGEGIAASPAAAGPVAPAAAAASLAPPAARANPRRFARGRALYSGQARCHAAKCRKALQARAAVPGR
jgi:hypothetical protein